MAAIRHSCPALQVHYGVMVLLPPQESATPDALADELERMLDRGVPPLAIGQWVAVNQSALVAALRLAAPQSHRNAVRELAKADVVQQIPVTASFVQ